MRSPCSVCVSPPPINFRMTNPIFIKLYMYTIAPKQISTVYFINLYRQSMCLYLCSFSLLGSGSINLPIFATQRFSKKVTAEANSHTTTEELLGTRRFLCCPCSIKERNRLFLHRTSCIFFWVYEYLTY
jgi:hypothetical protein